MLLMLDVAKLLKNSVGCAFAAGFLLKIKVQPPVDKDTVELYGLVHGAGNHSILVIDISVNHSCVHSYADVFAQQVVRTELVMQSHPSISSSTFRMKAPAPMPYRNDQCLLAALITNSGPI